jgi:hypothetical protein
MCKCWITWWKLLDPDWNIWVEVKDWRVIHDCGSNFVEVRSERAMYAMILSMDPFQRIQKV